MDVKQSVARDDEPHFVFAMPMFTIKLREHCVEPGRLRINVDHVCGDITTLSFQLFDLFRVGAQHLLRRRVRRDVMLGPPLLVIDAARRQVISDCLLVAYCEPCFRNSDYCHCPALSSLVLSVINRVRPIASSKNSRISMCLFACAKSLPQV